MKFLEGDRVKLLANVPGVRPSLIDAATGAESSIKGMSGEVIMVERGRVPGVQHVLVFMKNGVWVKRRDGVIQRLRILRESTVNLDII